MDDFDYTYFAELVCSSTTENQWIVWDATEFAHDVITVDTQRIVWESKVIAELQELEEA
jgi:hypothetical protein